MNDVNASPRERVITLTIGLLYLWLTLGASGNVNAGIGAAVFVATACLFIWYPRQLSMITVNRGMYWLKPIPPILFRWFGWCLLLLPLAFAMVSSLVMTLGELQTRP
ncbi:MAG: hypothetical protein IT365_14200 [Candidatus Hydrogenedentes bacterium]|nr:hypothetical protein [Candidatus Hydrogenedentota bacterium]